MQWIQKPEIATSGVGKTWKWQTTSRNPTVKYGDGANGNVCNIGNVGTFGNMITKGYLI